MAWNLDLKQKFYCSLANDVAIRYTVAARGVLTLPGADGRNISILKIG